MRYIKGLTEWEKKSLEEMQKHHRQSQVRRRAHMILLSNQGQTINEIAAIYEMRRNTVASCMDKWESYGLAGLMDKLKSGRPRLLTAEEEVRGLELIKEDQRSSKQAQSRLESETGKKLSEWTFKRSLKRAGLRWKRMRRSLKSKQDPDKLKASKEKIADFKLQEAQGIIDLYYFDESGVSTISDVPYGWQPVGDNYCFTLSSQ